MQPSFTQPDLATVAPEFDQFPEWRVTQEQLPGLPAVVRAVVGVQASPSRHLLAREVSFSPPLGPANPSSSPNQPFWVFFGVFGRTMRLSSAGSIVPSGNSNVVQTYCLESGIGIVTRSTQNVSAAAQSPQGRQGSHLLVSG